MSDAVLDALRETNFSTFDWAIVIGYLLVSLVIGILVRHLATDMTNYIGAGRSLGSWLGIATMTGTELGLVTVMYSAQKGFKFGFAAFHIAVLAGVVTFFVGLTGFIVAPLRRLEVLTIPEFYERRFDRRTRVLGGFLLAFGGILNMGLFLKVGSMFVVGVTGLPPDGLALPIVMTVLLVLVLVYTVLGGMISVVITDYLQFVLLSLGMVLTTALAIRYVGWHEIFVTVRERMGTAGFDPLQQEGGFGPAYVTWMGILGLVGCAVWPTAVARALAMKNTTELRKQYMWSSLSFLIRFLIPYFWGICALTFIANQADLEGLFFTPAPVTETLEIRIEGGNASEMPGGSESAASQSDPPPAAAPSTEPPLQDLYAMPLFLGRILPAGLLGLISAAMIAAFMSTHDSYLLCWSSVITQDVVAPLRKEPLTAEQRIRLTRWLIVAIGIFVWAWGLFYEGSDDIWDYMAITGAIYFVGAIVVLVGGLYWKRASRRGAFAALLTGCSAILSLEPIRARLAALIAPLTQLSVDELRQAVFSSDRMNLASLLLTVIVFISVSLLFPDEPDASVVGESKGAQA